MSLPRPAPGTARWWIIGVVLTSLALAWMTWFALVQADQPRPTVTAYQVISDSQVRLEYDLFRPGGDAMICTATAQDNRKARVGMHEDTIPAGSENVSRSVTVRTSARAVTALISSCVRATQPDASSS